MIRNLLAACLLATMIMPLASCSHATQESVASRALVAPKFGAQLLGPGAAISMMATRTIPGQEPSAYAAITTESTPTAGQVFGALAALSRDYAGQGRWIGLAVALPESYDNGSFTLCLRYNPTAGTIPTIGATPSLPPGMLLLDIARGSGNALTLLNEGSNIVLASNVSTDALLEAADGKGAIVRRLLSHVSLR